ncbi:MAG: YjjG family noncanonical pyrimidine nucleotidase [Bacteroidales bacterium]|nr:YjjG family noncanonical pyrimidine nucleotidase [Bacteroidales bacterium]
MKYRHIFFDLDRTLWDFDRGSHETFFELFDKFNLKQRGIANAEKLYNTYLPINKGLWDQYRTGEIEKEYLNFQRFHRSLVACGLDDPGLSSRFAADFVALTPLKSYLFPHVIDTLEYLSGRYQLHIITNGFEEVQMPKIRNNGLERYFNTITTSEEAGVKKPFREIFLFALRKAGAAPHESLMIGDDIEVDIRGAKAIGMDQMFFNFEGLDHSEPVTYEIRSMNEIPELL